MNAHILIVEDDASLRLALADNLEDEGYRVTVTASGGEARAWLLDENRSFDLLVLDIMLPDVDGYSLCRELRAARRTLPVLMLTARTLEDDLVTGFEAGADDFLTKPYRLRELLVRVKALLRRRVPAADAVQRCAEFRLDPSARTVHDAAGRPITLTRTEFDLLALFLRRRGEALTRDTILDDVWGPGVIVDGRTVDNFVSNLKKKLRWSPGSGFRFATLRGVGYRLEVDD